jgi:hypothetical protein
MKRLWVNWLNKHNHETEAVGNCMDMGCFARGRKDELHCEALVDYRAMINRKYCLALLTFSCSRASKSYELLSRHHGGASSDIETCF